MNLLRDPWLLFNVLQPDGSITEQTLPITAIARPEVIDFALPRADFQGAAYQFAIGLLQTCFAPDDEFQWQDNYLEPPTEVLLQQAFSKAEHAFNVSTQPDSPFWAGRSHTDRSLIHSLARRKHH